MGTLLTARDARRPSMVRVEQIDVGFGGFMTSISEEGRKF